MTPRKTETSDRLSLATTAEFHQEIARLHGVTDRLRAEIERLRSRPCPYVTGAVTQHCTLTPFTLTDAEREAVEKAARLSSDWGPEWADHTATLRGLLERVSDRPKPIATPLAECTPGVCTYPPECTDTGET